VTDFETELVTKIIIRKKNLVEVHILIKFILKIKYQTNFIKD